MKDRELFKACVSQCIWCKEQWPVLATGGHMLHVGPYTRDKQLFSTICKAESIRQAFEYITYKGGKQVVWKARKPAALRKVIENYYEKTRKSNGLGMTMDSPQNRSFWRTGIRCTLDVAEWPKWKSGGEVSPERIENCRHELLFFDECDYVTRQQCSGNLQYRPTVPDRGNMNTPTCNGGFGCVTCWERYEKAYDKMSESWCD